MYLPMKGTTTSTYLPAYQCAKASFEFFTNKLSFRRSGYLKFSVIQK